MTTLLPDWLSRPVVTLVLPHNTSIYIGFRPTFDEKFVVYFKKEVLSPMLLLVSASPMIQPTLLLGLPTHLRLDRIEITPQTLIVSLATETAEAACPLCRHLSYCVHSHYAHTLEASMKGKSCDSWYWFAMHTPCFDQGVCTANQPLHRTSYGTWLCAEGKSCRCS